MGSVVGYPAVPRARLMQRIHESIERHATMVTRRVAGEAWRDAGGRQVMPLYDGGGVSARLLRLGAEAVPHARGGELEEWLVLDGELALGSERFQRGGWLLAASDTLAAAHAVGAEATLFSRAWMPEAGVAAADEAAWWPAEARLPRWHRPQPGDWIAFAPGIELLPLQAAGDVMSMLARFAPGARLPAHRHGLDEHCVMLEGDLFLGDVLLREHDYQLAPAGSAHGELMSDVGCVLFFHGAVDRTLGSG